MSKEKTNIYLCKKRFFDKNSAKILSFMFIDLKDRKIEFWDKISDTS